MKFHKIFLSIMALVLLVSTFAVAAPASASSPSKEIFNAHAQVTRVKVGSVAPGAVTIRVSGAYACDKVRYDGYVSGKTIYIEVWDVKLKGNKCDNNVRFSRDLTFTGLVPGTYRVRVNVDPETNKHQRALKGVIVPVYEASASTEE